MIYLQDITYYSKQIATPDIIIDSPIGKDLANERVGCS
jgi:hypothetical protein